MKSARKQYTAVIEISPFREPPSYAIQTVLSLHKYFASVRIISETVTLQDKLYKKWPLHVRQLKERKVQLFHHTHLEIDQIKTHLIVRIPPMSSVKPATFLRLHNRVRNIPRTDQPRHAIAPMTDLNMYGFSVWYIFLTLVFVIDWWRNMFAWFTFYAPEHIRVEEILSGAGRVVIHPSRSPAWCTCCGACRWLHGKPGDRTPLIYASSNAICAPSRRVSGLRYFLYRMHHRTTFSPGWFYWFVIAAVLYLAIGLAWWAPIAGFFWQLILGSLGTIVNDSSTAQAGIDIVYAMIEPLGPFRIAIIAVSWVLHTIVLNRYFRWRHRFWVALTFPLAMPILPVVMLWARLYQQHETWEHSMDTIEELNDATMDEVPTYYDHTNVDDAYVEKDELLDAMLQHSHSGQ